MLRVGGFRALFCEDFQWQKHSGSPAVSSAAPSPACGVAPSSLRGSVWAPAQTSAAMGMLGTANTIKENLKCLPPTPAPALCKTKKLQTQPQPENLFILFSINNSGLK